MARRRRRSSVFLVGHLGSGALRRAPLTLTTHALRLQTPKRYVRATTARRRALGLVLSLGQLGADIDEMVQETYRPAMERGPSVAAYARVRRWAVSLSSARQLSQNIDCGIRPTVTPNAG
ncbi:MAG: hypothetical protein LC749_10900 [Actinobacteria bacterium]|nr:hypothetical protein [Actinomycetota bacterium]